LPGGRREIAFAGCAFSSHRDNTHIRLLNGVTRTAKYLGSQGCVTFPLGESAFHFRPVVVKNQPPDKCSLFDAGVSFAPPDWPGAAGMRQW